jgi:TatD DNase family protein
MPLIDVHCHIDLPNFNGDREVVIRKAKEKGIVALINSGLGSVSGRKTLRIAEEYRGYFFSTLGLEPYNLNEGKFKEMERLIMENRWAIVGIGEVGLDYYWTRGEEARRLQRERFKSFIHLARELDLPLIVHSRSAGKYALQILEEEGAERVLLHAFDGSLGWAMTGVKLGYFFSIPTSVWHSSQKQKLAKHLPLSHIMVESDSPVLSPFGKERNVPANLVYAVKKLCEIKGIEEIIVENETYQNTVNFFQLKGIQI